MSRRGRRVASLVFGVGLSAAGLAFVGRALAEHRTAALDALTAMRPGWLGLAMIVSVGAMVTAAVLWHRALHEVGGTLGTGRTVGLYFRGEVGKYVPGGVWATIGRGELARRDGVPADVSYTSVLLTLAVSAMAAAVAAVALLPFRTAGTLSVEMLSLAVLPLGLVGLHPRLLGAVLERLERWAGRPSLVRIPRWGRTVGLVVRYVGVWAQLSLAAWLVTRALVGDPPLGEVMLASIVAALTGFLAVPAPAGLGVQEVTFLALTPSLDPGVAAAASLMARLLLMLTDAGGAVIASAIQVRAGPAQSLVTR